MSNLTFDVFWLIHLNSCTFIIISILGLVSASYFLVSITDIFFFSVLTFFTVFWVDVIFFCWLKRICLIFVHTEVALTLRYIFVCLFFLTHWMSMSISSLWQGRQCTCSLTYLDSAPPSHPQYTQQQRKQHTHTKLM